MTRQLALTFLIVLVTALLLALANTWAAVCYESRGNDLKHWSWRIIDGKQCWYRGAPGKSKYKLRWRKFDPNPYGDPSWYVEN